MKNLFLYSLLLISLLSCIGDDFLEDRVDPVLRILSDLQTLEINTDYQLNYVYLNNIGAEETIDVVWSSSDISILTVNNTGLVSAESKGEATIIAEYENNEGIITQDEITLIVDDTTIIIEEEEESRNGVIATTTFYDLSGTFTIDSDGDGIIIDIADDYEASTGLPGLYLYLSNNRNSIANAKEISMVDVFNGAHSYRIDDVSIDDYSFLLYFCKPFNVKVGDGEIQ